MPAARSSLWTRLKPVVPTFVLLAVLEILLRVAGLGPQGRFDFLLPGGPGGLYAPDETLSADWGRIPYVVHSTALGLRSTGHPGPRLGASRIVTIGDSVTDGFFVDDDATLQHFLQRALDEAGHADHEVLNAARGGGSIDKELAILREVGLGLKPDVVVLTFVTNDIWELRRKTPEQLDAHALAVHRRNVGWVRRGGLWFFTRTAVGEAIFSAWWRFVLTPSGDGQEVEVAPDTDRYAIPGGADHATNSARFLRKFGTHDGLVLTDTFSPTTLSLVARYLQVLTTFVTTCRDHAITPVFVYFPAYPQVHDPEAPARIQTVLRERCEQLAVPFLDLTGPLRAASADRVLTLAPVDFHPNPAGNEVIGRTIAAFLQEQGLLRPDRPRPARSPDRSSSPGSSSSAGD